MVPMVTGTLNSISAGISSAVGGIIRVYESTKTSTPLIGVISTGGTLEESPDTRASNFSSLNSSLCHDLLIASVVCSRLVSLSQCLIFFSLLLSSTSSTGILHEALRSVPNKSIKVSSPSNSSTSKIGNNSISLSLSCQISA